MYTEKTTPLGDDVIEVQQYGYALLGGPGKPRRKKEKGTDKKAKKANDKTRSHRIQQLLLHNFKPGDLHIIMNFHPEEVPDTYAEAVECLRRFLRRVRKYYQERGHVFKYIAVVERGKRRAALHIHLITEAIDVDNILTVPALQACWSGKITSFDMYEQGDFEQLADYIVKAAGKEENGGASYHRSRNLKEPVSEKRTVWFKRFPEEPKAPEGWYVVKDSVKTGTNPYTKKPTQRYLLRRIKHRADDRHIRKYTAAPAAWRGTIPKKPAKTKKTNTLFDKIKTVTGKIWNTAQKRRN